MEYDGKKFFRRPLNAHKIATSPLAADVAPFTSALQVSPLVVDVLVEGEPDSQVVKGLTSEPTGPGSISVWRRKFPLVSLAVGNEEWYLAP